MQRELKLRADAELCNGYGMSIYRNRCGYPWAFFTANVLDKGQICFELGGESVGLASCIVCVCARCAAVLQ